MEGVFPDYQITITDGVLQGNPAPIYNLTKGLGYFIYEACEKYSEQLFQICPFTNKVLTFGEFKVQSVNLALNLRKFYSIQPEDIIMTCMKNSLGNSIPIAATFFLNAVTCSLDPSLSVRDSEHLIGLAEPKVIIVDGDVVENIKTALKNIGKEVILIVNHPNSVLEKGDIELHKLIHFAEYSEEFRPVVIEDSNSMSTILFSSGTTGLPKGICMSQKSLYFSTNLLHIYMGTPKIIALCTTFYWISGLVLFLTQFINGSTKIALKKFDIDELCAVLKKYNVESAFLTTSYLSKMFQAEEKIKKLSSFRNIFTGGMMATKGLFDKLRKTFPRIEFIQGYGLSESALSGTGFLGKYKSLSYDFPHSTGVPIPGVHMKIVDEDSGKILGPNETGVIYLKSTWHMLGYHKYNGPNPFTEDGFINTGDMGYYDENKLFYISGRSKDMFKYQSWHIVPASIEAVIKEHPAVEEAVVFGISHGDEGHLPSAAVTLKEHYAHIMLPEDIANFVMERVADRQRLRGGVYILKEMPRTVTGKIQSNKLCDMFSNFKKNESV